MGVSLVPEFFYDFCLGKEVTLAGQSHRDLSTRLSYRFSLNVRALFSSRRLMTCSRNIIFTPRSRPFSLSLSLLFLRSPVFCRNSYAPDTTCAAGHLPRVTCSKGLPVCVWLSIFKSRRMNERDLARKQSSPRTYPRHNIPELNILTHTKRKHKCFYNYCAISCN